MPTKKPKQTEMDKKIAALKRRKAKELREIEAQRAERQKRWAEEALIRNEEREHEYEERNRRQEVRESLSVIEGGNYFYSKKSQAKLTVFINEEYAS